MTTRHDMIIGGLNEKELIALDYMETPDSGMPSFDRLYDSAELGWMHDRMVEIRVYCYKRDVGLIMAALPITPSNLTSTGSKLNNGEDAPRVQWGSGYVLDTVNGSKAPAPSFVELAATYKKRVPEAMESYPSGLTISGVNGVYTLYWLGVAVKDLDNGTGSNGSYGFQLIKFPEVIKRYTTIRHSGDTVLEVTSDYKYACLSVQVDGVEQLQSLVLLEVLIVNAEHTITSGTDGDTLISTAYGDTDYAASVSWEVSGSRLSLVFCGASVWQFEPS